MHRGAELRKDPTFAEIRLWNFLKLRQLDGVRFRRQHSIGRYIVDFCAIKEKLIIELDGSQHLNDEEHDKERTEFLNSKGFRVIRFWNNEVMNNIQGVLQEIENYIHNN